MDAGRALRQARRSAGLTQRQVALRAGVPQPAVARVERGTQVPRVDTLAKMLGACGHELRIGPRRGDGVDRSQIREYLALTPRQRIERASGWGDALDRIAQARPVRP